MEEEDERGKEEEGQGEKKSEFVIKIPSYEEVLNASQSQSHPPPSLFKPSQSFSQAFSFIKSSPFYSPPPPPPLLNLNPPTLLSPQRPPGNRTDRTLLPLLLRLLLRLPRRWLRKLLKIATPFSLAIDSLRYHLLHPDYLYYRIRELQKNFKLRVVLCHVDVEDVVKPLLEVTKTALLHDCTLLCGWSLEECGRYLETIKVYENKPADIIQGQTDTDYVSRLNHALTTVRHVNKTDVVTLGSTFGSLSHIMDVSMEDLARCPGIGERKVKRLYDTFHEPFKRVIPKHVTIPEVSTQNKAESSSVIEENEEREEDASKRRKKEPEITIKSALSAAFSKYSDRIGKKNNLEQKVEESSSACGSEGKNSSYSEEPAG